MTCELQRETGNDQNSDIEYYRIYLFKVCLILGQNIYN